MRQLPISTELEVELRGTTNVRGHQRADPRWAAVNAQLVAQRARDAQAVAAPPVIISPPVNVPEQPAAAAAPQSPNRNGTIETQPEATRSCGSKKRPFRIDTGTLAARGLNNPIPGKTRRQLDKMFAADEKEEVKKEAGASSTSTEEVN